MFKKLRKDFVLLNMAIIGTLMISTFIIVYLTMYQNTMSKIKERITNMPTGNLNFNPRDYNGSDNGIFSGGILPVDYSLSFNVFLNNRGELLRINSYVDMSEEMYIEAAESALKNNKEYGTIKLQQKLK